MVAGSPEAVHRAALNSGKSIENGRAMLIHNIDNARPVIAPHLCAERHRMRGPFRRRTKS
jgi:hypothetical protein